MAEHALLVAKVRFAERNEMPDTATPTLHRLDSHDSTCVFRLDQGPPTLLYWGDRLSASANLGALTAALERSLPHGQLDQEEPLSWLPENGRGFFGRPGIVVHRDGRSQITWLETESLEKTATRVRSRLHEPRGEFSLCVTLALDEDTGVLESQCTIENLGEAALTVEWLTAGALAPPTSCDELLLFDGRWCREFSLERQRLTTGIVMKENRVGRTSHHSFPALLCGVPGFGEETGELFGCHLGWSGNHRLFAERLRDGRLQVQFGELLSPGEIRLATGAMYSTPTLFACRSGSGLNELSRRFHRYLRTNILPRAMRTRPRPVHFNTWETLYFDHSEEKTLALVDEAAAIGAERFVLDDGWFAGRRSDRVGLGDWRVCPEKYPNGLEPIAEAVRAHGMELGLWIEPEMVNRESELYRKHPEWVLGDPERVQPLGRHQYALDLTRDDVQSHLARTIVSLIDRYSVGYLKWDMNRDLCHVVTDGRPAGHLMTLGVYRLFDAVRAERPSVEIETCSSGGGRCDFEILRRAERVWVSDSHDPKERQEIERGFSLFFPPEIMGSHVGSERSETSGRRHGMGFRAATALFGHMGLESSVGDLDQEDEHLLRSLLSVYKTNRSWLHQATMSYVPVADPGCLARLLVAADRTRALLSVAQLETPRFVVPAVMRIRGLDDKTSYAVRCLDTGRRPAVKYRTDFHRGDTLDTTGDALRRVGVQLPVLHPDTVTLLAIEKKSA